MHVSSSFLWKKKMAKKVKKDVDILESIRYYITCAHETAHDERNGISFYLL